MTSRPLTQRARPRGRETVGDMMRSLTIVLGPVIVLFAFFAWALPDDGPYLPTVNYAADVRLATQAADYPVVVPDPLPSGWHVSSVRVAGADGPAAGEPVSLHLGMITAAEEYAGLEQSDAPRAAVLGRVLGESTERGTETVAGQRWQLREGEKGRLALVRPAAAGDASTLIVTGTGGLDELRQLAASLSVSASESAAGS